MKHRIIFYRDFLKAKFAYFVRHNRFPTNIYMNKKTMLRWYLKGWIQDKEIGYMYRIEDKIPNYHIIVADREPIDHLL